jgi:peptidoglycan/xylan/chitin deacetylase (PgdA/CDA1 family)
MDISADLFAPLVAELDIWADRGRTATFWWRDDDAVCATPALDRLRRIVEDIPVGLAVIPAMVDASLLQTLDRWPAAEILCHGFAHRNWAPPGRKKCELGADRAATEVLAEVGRGRELLAGLFGKRLLPVQVPPWNRIDPGLVPHLAALGWLGLSTFGDRSSSGLDAGLIAVNTHVDIMGWSDRRGLAVQRVVAIAVERLQNRRSRAVDQDEPIGILSHHLAHDAAAWDSCIGLAATVSAHRAARWLGPSEAFEG